MTGALAAGEAKCKSLSREAMSASCRWVGSSRPPRSRATAHGHPGFHNVSVRRTGQLPAFVDESSL